MYCDADHLIEPRTKKPQQWEAWKKTYDELVDYLKVNLFWPPSKGETLGKWCTTQRTLWRREQLDEERFKLLNDIGFIWHPPNVTYHRQQARADCIGDSIAILEQLINLHILLTNNDTTDCGIFSIKTTRNFRKKLELLALGVMTKR
jgi:hypothetical protein